MSDDKARRLSSAVESFKSLRRTSRPLHNIFGESDAPRDEPEPPARIEAETRRLGRVNALQAPVACPPELVDALRTKSRKIGPLSDRALLFQADYAVAESAIMVCFSDVDPTDRARVEGAVADALVASGHEGHALGVLFLDAGSRTLSQIDRLAVDLKA
ncbi:MAG: hypothetical protein AAF762_13225 [Pseudomonadota bacterium]